MVRKKRISKKKEFREVLDPIFIPVLYDAYRNSKVNLLKAQVKLLECVKVLNRLRELKKEKENLKLQLYRDLSEAMRFYYKFQDLMPSINNPGLIKKFEKTMEIAINYQDGNSNFSYSHKVSQPDVLDSELIEIQEKLNSLNSAREVL